MNTDYLKDVTLATLGFMMAHIASKRFFKVVGEDQDAKETLLTAFTLSAGVQMMMRGVRGWDS